MKEKIINRVFLFLLFFFTWLDLSKFMTVPVSKISEPLPIFPQIQINLLKSKNPKIANDAAEETAKMLLRYFVPELSEKTWQTRFAFINIIPGDDPEIVISLSLPPEKGLLIILQKENSHYFIAYYHDQLSPVTKLESLPYKDNQSFLITKEEQEKQWGSLNTATQVKLWHWRGNRLEEIFAEKTKWKIIWQNTLQEPNLEPQKWFSLTQNLTISYHQENGKLFLRSTGQQQLLEAPVNTAFPPFYDFPSPFKNLKTRDVFQEYYWDEQWHKFIIKTSHYLPPGQNNPEEIAILKDLANHLETLAFEGKEQFLVLNKKGETFPLPKKNLIVHNP